MPWRWLMAWALRGGHAQFPRPHRILRTPLLSVVIPAKAGLSTAELAIHFALRTYGKIKVDSRFRGNDDIIF